MCEYNSSYRQNGQKQQNRRFTFSPVHTFPYSVNSVLLCVCAFPNMRCNETGRVCLWSMRSHWIELRASFPHKVSVVHGCPLLTPISSSPSHYPPCFIVKLQPATHFLFLLQTLLLLHNMCVCCVFKVASVHLR